MLALYIAALFALFSSRSLTDGFGYQSWGVSALTLDARTSRIWEENSSIIQGIAQQRLCKDGSAPRLEKIQLDGELTTYELQCDDTSWRNTSMDTRELSKRQITSLCTTSCSRNCYHPADYNPDLKDCESITAVLRSRNSNWNIAVGATSVIQSRTCIYTFTNQASSTLNFCDSAWASIGDSIASTCGRWLSDPAKGGICNNPNFYVEALRAPNMPEPSLVIFSSLGEITESRSSSTSTSSFSIPSSSPQSGGSTTTSIRSTSSSIVLGSNATSQSTASYETLHNTPGSAGATSLTPESSNSVSNSNTQVNGPRKMNVAAIVGGTIGGIVAVLLLLLIVFFLLRRPRHYKETNSEKLDPYASASYATSSRPSMSSWDSDPFTIAPSNAFMIGLDTYNEKASLSREFGPASTPHLGSQWTMSPREQLGSPAIRSDTSNSIITDSSIIESRPSEDIQR